MIVVNGYSQFAAYGQMTPLAASLAGMRYFPWDYSIHRLRVRQLVLRRTQHHGTGQLAVDRGQALP
jgi:hypothetical protein